MEEKEKTENKTKETSKKKDKKSGIILIVCIIVMLIAVVGVLAVTRWKERNGDVTIQSTDVKTVADSAYRLSGNSLEDFDLYFLQLENDEKNKIYSPLSIKYALAMLNEGTVGESHDQIASVIGDYKAKKYKNNEHMSFANAMFIRNSFKESVISDYTKTLSENYGAEIIFDEFKNASTMNDWVSNKTFKLIDKLLSDDVVEEGNFFLINALAIDMNWKNRIQSATAPLPEGMGQTWYHVNYTHEKYATYISPIENDKYPSMKFNGEENIKSVEVGASYNHYDIISDLGEDNIRKNITEKYTEWTKEHGENECGPVKEYVDGYIKAIGQNYKQEANSTDFLVYVDDELKLFAKDLQTYDGTTLQYIGVMPKQVELGTYIKELNAKSLDTTLSKLREAKYDNFKEGVVTKITGNIPLFKFDYKLNLLEDLETLGIKDVFDVEKADLSKMVTTEKQYIFDATHKANIEFSNDGIKAAAATSMGGAGSSGCGFEYEYEVPVEEIDITFDKPYLFLIRDKDTGEVWFTGTVYSPEKNS